MSDAQKPRRVRCPYCSKRVALTKTGKLHAHLDPETKRPCVIRAQFEQIRSPQKD